MSFVDVPFEVQGAQRNLQLCRQETTILQIALRDWPAGIRDADCKDQLLARLKKMDAALAALNKAADKGNAA